MHVYIHIHTQLCWNGIMSRSPTSAELSSTSSTIQTRVWRLVHQSSCALRIGASVLQHPKNSQVAGFWMFFQWFASKSHIFPNRSPFPSGFRHSKSSGKIPYWFISGFTFQQAQWDGKTLARSRVSCQFRIKDWRPWIPRKTMSFFQGDRIELIMILYGVYIYI